MITRTVKATAVAAAAAVLLASCALTPPQVITSAARPAKPALNQVGDRLRGPMPSFYVSLPQLGEIAQVDPTTGQIANTFDIGGSLGAMLADSVQPKVFAISGNSIAVVNTVFHHIVTRIPLPEPARSWSLASKSSRLYVAGALAVYVISTSTYQVVATVTMPSTIGAIAASPQHHKVFVTLPATDRIAVIDTPSDVLEKRAIYTGSCNGHQCKPIGIAVSADGRYAVALSTADAYSIGIDAGTNHVMSKTQLSCRDRHPQFVGSNDASGLAWFYPCERFSGAPLVPVSLQPPFNELPFSDNFYGEIAPVQVAFGPDGAGFLVGYCPRYCRYSYLIAISTTNVISGTSQMPSVVGGIAYVPLISR